MGFIRRRNALTRSGIEYGATMGMGSFRSLQQDIDRLE